MVTLYILMTRLLFSILSKHAQQTVGLLIKVIHNHEVEAVNSGAVDYTELLFTGNNAIGNLSVSYTHLDVYKRQDIDSVLIISSDLSMQ